ncbi:hypothetical protein OPQ81_010139 [Rhizoctonia solani]|nr:hypothetical protein OPQ81_010139 [Rhizoctonia solani]
MLFTKQIVVFASLLIGTLARAAVIPMPMPMANAVSEMKPRDVKMISAYEKRQDDVVTVGDSAPMKAPDGVLENYPRQASDIVEVGDSAPMKAPDGVLQNYPRQESDVVTIGDSAPMKAPDGVLQNYPRQAGDIVEVGDSTPMKAPDGVLQSYPRKVARKELPRMRPGVGTLVSAVQNALDHHNRGAAGILTRTGGTIGFFTAMGATFAFTEAAVANQRQTDDSLNGAAGGCAAGLLAGLRARSIPMAFASCAVIGTLVASFDAAGRSLTGGPQDTAAIDIRAERRNRFFKKPPPLDAATE